MLNRKLIQHILRKLNAIRENVVKKEAILGKRRFEKEKMLRDQHVKLRSTMVVVVMLYREAKTRVFQ